MTQPDFIESRATVVRLAPSTANALGLGPNQDIELYAARVCGGWLQADYRNTDGTFDRYLLPAESVIYVKQRITEREVGRDVPAPSVVNGNTPTLPVGSNTAAARSDAVR